MTTEERFDRIEHITAGLAEERRKDREESRQLWRDTQRQINELAIRTTDLTERIDQMAVETNAAITRLAEESRLADQKLAAADEKLGQRIDSLVSAIGEMLRGRNGGTQ